MLVIIWMSLSRELFYFRLLKLGNWHRNRCQYIFRNSCKWLCKAFQSRKTNSLWSLKTAVNNLFNRQFSYTQPFQNTERVEYVKSRWVSRISYVDESAILNITFAPDIVPLITKLEKHFTSYQLKRVAQLTSKYAIRLYELLIQWREVGKTQY